MLAVVDYGDDDDDDDVNVDNNYNYRNDYDDDDKSYLPVLRAIYMYAIG